MTTEKSLKVCSVCAEPLTITKTQEYLGDPMHRICGPGSRNQNTTVIRTHCGTCGLTYINGGGIEPKTPVPAPKPNWVGDHADLTRAAHSMMEEWSILKLEALHAVLYEAPLSLTQTESRPSLLRWLRELQSEDLVKCVKEEGEFVWRHTPRGETLQPFVGDVIRDRESPNRKEVEWSQFNEHQRGIIAALKHGPARLLGFEPKDILQLQQFGWISRMKFDTQIKTWGVRQWVVAPERDGENDKEFEGYGIKPAPGTRFVPGDFRVIDLNNQFRVSEILHLERKPKPPEVELPSIYTLCIFRVEDPRGQWGASISFEINGGRMGIPLEEPAPSPQEASNRMLTQVEEFLKKQK